MRNFILSPVRAALVAAALVLAGQAAEAGRSAAHEPAAARTTGRTKSESTAVVGNDEFPVEGALIIVGIVGVIVLLAWVCSRVGDNRSVSAMW